LTAAGFFTASFFAVAVTVFAIFLQPPSGYSEILFRSSLRRILPGRSLHHRPFG
jgi:hypothetical protein